MFYKATLIVDTPNYPKGTQFDIDYNFKNGYRVFLNNNKVDFITEAEFKEKDHWLLNGKFAKVELREECFKELKCPVCGDCKVFLRYEPEWIYNNKYDEYDYVVKTTIYCKNGHRTEVDKVTFHPNHSSKCYYRPASKWSSLF